MTDQETRSDSASTVKDLQAELSKKITKTDLVQKFNDKMRRTKPFLPKTERLLETPNQQWISHNNSRG